MTLAYLVYILSLTLMLIASVSYKGYLRSGKKGQRNLTLWLISAASVAIVSLMMAFRYEVGTDWKNYKYIFDSYSSLYMNNIQDVVTNDRIEPLYLLLNYFVAKCGGSYQLFLFIIMGLHLCLLLAMCRTFPANSALIVFFYFTVLFLSTLNIHRQTLAICLFLFAMHLLAANKTGKYYLLSATACLVHYSSIVILMVPILKSKLFRFLDKRYVALALYVSGFFIGHILMDMIVSYVPLFTDNAKYNSTLENLEHVHEYSSGLGLLFYKALDIILILNFPKFVQKGFGIYSRTFLVGSVVANAFANSMFLARVALPFTSIKIFLLALLLSDYLKDKKLTIRKSAAVLIIMIAFMGFLMNIASHNSGCSPFQFI